MQGHLLIASTRLLDPNFVQAVVLMVQHDKKGALGLVLNRPTDLGVKNAWEQVSETDCVREDNIYVGGPCEGVLMAIHPFKQASQIEIMPDLFFATETEHIEWLMKQDEPHMRFFAGYAGWTSGQLEGELETGSWITTPATVDRIFCPHDAHWGRIKRELALAAVVPGYNPRIVPEDPSHN